MTNLHLFQIIRQLILNISPDWSPKTLDRKRREIIALVHQLEFQEEESLDLLLEIHVFLEKIDSLQPPINTLADQHLLLSHLQAIESHFNVWVRSGTKFFVPERKLQRYRNPDFV